MSAFAEKQVIASRLRQCQSPVDAKRLADEIEAGIPVDAPVRGALLPLHIYRVDSIAQVAAVSTSQAYPLDFSGIRGGGDLAIVGMVGQVSSAADADMATLEVAININGDEEFFTTGQGRAFVPFQCLFPKNAPQLWLPGRGVPVTAGDRWNCTFKNTGAGNITPSLCFFVRTW